MTPQAKSKSAPAAKASSGKSPKPFMEMIKEAIKSDEGKKGLSRAAIKNFISSKYAVDFKDRTKVSILNRTIKKGIDDQIIRNGRSTGVFKLGKKAETKARKPKAAKTDKATKKPRAKSSDKASPAKEAKPKTVKKTPTKKTSLKKTASKIAKEQ